MSILEQFREIKALCKCIGIVQRLWQGSEPMLAPKHLLTQTYPAQIGSSRDTRGLRGSEPIFAAARQMSRWHIALCKPIWMRATSSRVRATRNPREKTKHPMLLHRESSLCKLLIDIGVPKQNIFKSVHRLWRGSEPMFAPKHLLTQTYPAQTLHERRSATRMRGSSTGLRTHICRCASNVEVAYCFVQTHLDACHLESGESNPVIRARKQNTRCKSIGCFVFWSGLRGSNPPPPPWQGGALPNELNPHVVPPVGIEPTTRGFSVPCSTN